MHFQQKKSVFQCNLRIAIAGNVWYYSLATQSHKSDTKGNDVFYLLVKTHSPLCIPLSVKDCVATNGALRFSCVVPFGAAHFLYSLEE